MDVTEEDDDIAVASNTGTSELESAGFLEKFGRMQTLDHDDLVSQMLRLIGDDKINVDQAKFYLEMNMWNVQSAVCSYFDLETATSSMLSQPLPSMTFVQDVTVGEGESVPPSTSFVKTWKVHNTGTERWPTGCRLKFTYGTRMCEDEDVQSLIPWQTAEISVKMTSPPVPGIYESKWRMCTPNGCFFGDPIFVIITVEPGGTLALTQQMSNFSELGQTSTTVVNPFAATRLQHAQIDQQQQQQQQDQEMNEHLC